MDKDILNAIELLEGFIGSNIFTSAADGYFQIAIDALYDKLRR